MAPLDASRNMRIPCQHSKIPVSAYRRDLPHGKTFLKQPRYRLMSQIVKMQIIKSSRVSSSSPSQLERVGRYIEQFLIVGELLNVNQLSARKF